MEQVMMGVYLRKAKQTARIFPSTELEDFAKEE